MDIPEERSSSPSVTAKKYDYSGLHGDAVAEVEEVAARIRSRLRASLIDTGRDLLAVKKKLPHGTFGQWLEFHFGWAERTAQHIMNAAKVFAKTPEVAEKLPPTLVYKLAARSTPEKIRESVVEEIRGGGQPEAKKVAALIAQASGGHKSKAGPSSTIDAGQPAAPSVYDAPVDGSTNTSNTSQKVSVSPIEGELKREKLSPTQKAEVLVQFLIKSHPSNFLSVRKLFMEADADVLQELMRAAGDLDASGTNPE